MAIRVSIVGLAKSGTSALYSAVKACLPAPRRLMFEPVNVTELAYVSTGHEQNALTKLMFSSLDRLEYTPDRFTHNIAIVRDPRDTVVSSVLFRFNRLRLINNKAASDRLIALFKRKEQDPRSVSMVELLESIEAGEAESFRAGFADQLSRFSAYLDLGKHHLITFDQMREGDLTDLNAYLGLELAPPPPLDGWIGKISRKGDSGDWKHWFSPSDVDYFRDSMMPFISKYGFSPDWELATPPVIEPEHCSQYIARLAEARRVDPNLKNAEVTDLDALRSAAEDGKIVALERLVVLLKDDGSDSARAEAAQYHETLGALGLRQHAKIAGRHYALAGDPARAIVSFRNAIAAGARGPVHYSLAKNLLAMKDPSLRKEAIAVLRRGAKMGNENCKQRLAKILERKAKAKTKA